MNARSTKFAKLRIKSEKADALAIERDRSRWLRRQLFRTLSSALRNGRICAQLRVQICGEPRSFLPSYILGSWSDRGIILLFSSPHIRGPLPSIADGHQPSGHHDPTPLYNRPTPYGPRHPLVHCLLVSCICALLAIYIDPASRIPISQSSPIDSFARGTGHLSYVYVAVYGDAIHSQSLAFSLV